MAPRTGHTPVILNVYDLSPANDYTSGSVRRPLFGSRSLSLSRLVATSRAVQRSASACSTAGSRSAATSSRSRAAPASSRLRRGRRQVRFPRHSLAGPRGVRLGTHCERHDRRRLPRGDPARRLQRLVRGGAAARVIAASGVRGRQLQPLHQVRGWIQRFSMGVDELTSYCAAAGTATRSRRR